MRTDHTYEGWRNRATWNYMLWLNNDYGMYCRMVEMLPLIALRNRDAGRKAMIYKADAMQLALQIVGIVTPDGYRAADVDWGEIAQAMNEILREMKRYGGSY